MFAGRLMAIFLAVSCFALAQPPLTTVQDILYKADGSRFNGTAVISWNTFDAGDTSVIGMQSLTTSIVNGALHVPLAPSTNANPPFVYTVRYESDGRQQFQELWAVPPASAPLRLRNVRYTGLLTAGTGGAPNSNGVVPPAGQTPILETDVVGLTADLQLRPVKGAGFAPNRAAVINPAGEVEAVAGNSDDCVHVDGTAGPCFDASMLATFVDGETPAGLVDGTNATFTLLNPPSPATSLAVFRNGVYQTAAADYTLTGSTIQFLGISIPQAGDILLASYRVGGNGGPAGSGLSLPLTNSASAGRGHATMVIGDSQTGNSAPNGGLPSLASNWFSQAAVESRSAIRYLGNAGLAGDLSANMLQRMQTDVISKSPDKVFIEAGSSDVGSLIPLANITANINAMIYVLKAANIQPILCTLPPRAPTDAGGNTVPAIAQELTALNIQIRKLADQQGVPLVDFYNLLVDPVTGLYKAGYSSDGINPAMPATRLMAQAAIAATKAIFDPVYPFLPAYDGDSSNLVIDPLFIQSPSKWNASTVSGNVPLQAATSTDPSLNGNSVKLTKSDIASVNAFTGSAITTGFHQGDRLAFVGRIKTAGCEAGALQFDIGLKFNPGSAAAYPIYHWPVDIQDGQWYLEVIVPAGATSITPIVTLNSGIGAVTLGQVGLLNLTALGL